MSLDPYREYQAAACTGRSAVELVIMLFEALVRFLEQGKERVEEEDVEGAHTALVKAQRIVMHLLSNVNEDDGGEAAQRLKGLYLFVLEKVVVANFQKSTKEIDEAMQVVQILQETWAELEAQERAQKPPTPAAQADGPASPHMVA